MTRTPSASAAPTMTDTSPAAKPDGPESNPASSHGWTAPGTAKAQTRVLGSGGTPQGLRNRAEGSPRSSAVILGAMAQKARQVRINQKSAMADMQALEQRSDDELLREQKYRSAALSILGARAAERYDADAARDYFRQAIAAARPQERMQIRRMADASIALAERRPDDLREAVEKLGQEAPSSRQLFLLRLTGLISPPPGASIWLRVRGISLLLLMVAALLAIGFGVVKLVSIPFGGTSTGAALGIGAVLILVVLGILALVGRIRQKRARAAASGG